jgi:hypothetical protein
MVAAAASAVNFSVGQASKYIRAEANTRAQNLAVGAAMDSFSPLTPSGGELPYTYSIRSGTLPSGLKLDPVTGTVSGIPAAAEATANVTFGVVDANLSNASTTSTVSFSVTVLPIGYVFAAGLTWSPITTMTYKWSESDFHCTNFQGSGVQGSYDWRLPTSTELTGLYSAFPNNSRELRRLGWILGMTWSSTSIDFDYYGVYLGQRGGYRMSLSNQLENFVTCVH